MKSLETQLAEKDKELRELRKVRLKQQLSDSGLPVPAQARIHKRFELAESLDSLGTAITEEKEYLRKVRAAPGRGRQQEAESSKPDLVECYRTLGLTEAEAKIAAGVEGAVEEIKENQKQLFNAAKSMGMSDAEAKAFSEPN
jgi:hypothetical protein